jgi:hypothetical protein
MTEQAQQGGSAMTENPWQDTARMYAQNADYWRDRAHRAERFHPIRAIRSIRRALSRAIR